jgi:UDP-3-O-[3-hydroxymyristoyl] N-acetylglucosamine deacetylase / 3-hydroxyacyl-[acyl-carrier-protein] dehydratase
LRDYFLNTSSNSMAEKQKTLAQELTLKGKGLHSGKEVCLRIKPSAINSGYRFIRVDIAGNPVIKALAENVVSTARGTTIEEKGAQVMTIEHLCAALYGLGIDNAAIEIDGPEVPILDGSSRIFVQEIRKAGIAEQDADKEYFEIKEKLVYRDDKKDVDIVVYPDDTLSIDVHVDFNSKVLGNQYASIQSLADFETEIASCKTFVFLHELEPLLNNNLIKGGDVDNALIIIENPTTKEQLDRLAGLFNKPKIEVLPEGYLNNTERAFRNEPARHKLLDVIGDLSLTGVPLKAKIIAKKPGHYANTELAKIIRKLIRKEKSKTLPPAYDPDASPLFDVLEIQRRLPHRPPFLLVDKITFMDEWVICGIKNVTMNEAFFVGHYPDEPIMPGVLQIEAMAQVGGILLLSKVPNPDDYVLYFLKIENIKFKHKVVPGDTLNIRMRLLESVKRGIALTYGQVFVGNTLVMEGQFMAQLAKKPETDRQ